MTVPPYLDVSFLTVPLFDQFQTRAPLRMLTVLFSVLKNVPGPLLLFARFTLPAAVQFTYQVGPRVSTAPPQLFPSLFTKVQLAKTMLAVFFSERTAPP